MTSRARRPRRRKFGLGRRMLVAACALITLPALIPTGAAQAAPPFRAQVRVNQVGYASGASKRAYLMTSTARPGATFRVVDARGDIVYSSVVGADPGSWS